MIGRTNAGGGGLNIKDYAISVTFPVGSECTCTDGVKVLKSKGALAGAWIFPVYPGTWTVTITDGEASKSETVVISDSNKSVALNIGYDYYVIRGGVYQNGITWSATQGSVTQGPPNFIINCYNGSKTVVKSSNITVPSYVKTLHINFTGVRSYYAGSISFLGYTVTTPGGGVGAWSTTIDVTATRGQTGVISFSFSGVQTDVYNHISIDNIWFE